MRRSHLTGQWLRNEVFVGLEDALTAVVPRNLNAFYPMYGCVERRQSPPFLAFAVYPPSGRLSGDVGQALREWAALPGVAERMHIGVGLHLPRAPSRRTMLFVLPLLCGINPMGAPVFDLPHDQDRLSAVLEGMNPEDMKTGKRLIQLLSRLHADRRSTPQKQNFVGGQDREACTGPCRQRRVRHVRGVGRGLRGVDVLDHGLEHPRGPRPALPAQQHQRLHRPVEGLRPGCQWQPGGRGRDAAAPHDRPGQQPDRDADPHPGGHPGDAREPGALERDRADPGQHDPLRPGDLRLPPTAEERALRQRERPRDVVSLLPRRPPLVLRSPLSAPPQGGRQTGATVPRSCCSATASWGTTWRSSGRGSTARRRPRRRRGPRTSPQRRRSARCPWPSW